MAIPDVLVTLRFRLVVVEILLWNCGLRLKVCVSVVCPGHLGRIRESANYFGELRSRPTRARERASSNSFIVEDWSLGNITSLSPYSRFPLSLAPSSLLPLTRHYTRTVRETRSKLHLEIALAVSPQREKRTRYPPYSANASLQETDNERVYVMGVKHKYCTS